MTLAVSPPRKGGGMYGRDGFSDPFGRGDHRGREIHKKITAHPTKSSGYFCNYKLLKG